MLATGALVTVRAKEGITWGEFVNNPEYNTVGLTLWNDAVIYSEENLKKAIDNDFETIYPNTFFGVGAGANDLITFSWEIIDSSWGGVGYFILGYPTTTTVFSKEELQAVFEAEGGKIEYWTLNP